ncbi:MAG TPA: Si-specific NAD(P)(+) transhydrogenase [Candidatus Methylacidiphilales bacterium]|nr:Si-specific NAD(P)(+) transhydrogenase [Candidatus Methylacidiphilales bacterium]
MSNEIKTYDLVIIGGGPAGLIGATSASNLHKTVALIHCHSQLGGAGINTGTVPSKTLRETALALSGMKSRELYGVDLSLRREVTISDFLGHEQNVRAIFNNALLQRLESHHTGLYYGLASFVDPHTVQVGPVTGALEDAPPPAAQEPVLLRGENILIATGSSPVRPDLFPFGAGEIYDSDTILKLDRIPKTMAVVGAGVIGSEYGCTFAALGAKAHIIDGRDKLLPFLDTEVSQALTAAMERSGIVFHWNEKVQKCVSLPSGEVTLSLSSGTSLTVDAVLVAAGRKSNIDRLNLPAAGVTTGERGLILVDHQFRTNVPHIFAAGDVIGFPALASTSMEQARRAVRHAFDAKVSGIAPLLPNGIYTIPEVSMVGETEESLKKKGIDYVAGRARYEENARGQIIGDKGGFLKLLFRRSDMKLLGVHLMGEIATDIIHIGLMAMLAGATAEIFVEACFNVPTLGVLYKAATLNALHKAAQDAPNPSPPVST